MMADRAEGPRSAPPNPITGWGELLPEGMVARTTPYPTKRADTTDPATHHCQVHAGYATHRVARVQSPARSTGLQGDCGAILSSPRRLPEIRRGEPGVRPSEEHDEDATYGRFTYWDVTSGLADEDRDPSDDRECRD